MEEDGGGAPAAASASSSAAAVAAAADPNKTMDPALQKKHQAMLDRLSARHQARPKSTTTATPTTTAASFLSQFSHAKRSIESQISSSLSTTPDSTVRKSQIADISSSISSLEQLLAENSYLLPSYELRSSLKSISDLKQSLETLNTKKKFSFKAKSTAAPTNPSPRPPPKPESEPEPSKTQSSPITIRDSPGIRNRENENLARNFRNSEMGEFTLSNLESCEVRLMGCVNAMFFNKLRNCKVYTGPVRGSVLIEEVEDCVFVLASHQIRIHYAKRCDFYLHVRSRPIIEDCGGVRFSPYCLRYEGIDGDLREAGLEEEAAENWSNVDDFKWLRAVQSPNWSVLEEDKRIGRVEINDVGTGDGDT